MDSDTEFNRIYRRHLTRLLTTLDEKGVLNELLSRHIRRSYKWFAEDVKPLIDGEADGKKKSTPKHLHDDQL